MPVDPEVSVMQKRVLCALTEPNRNCANSSTSADKFVFVYNGLDAVPEAVTNRVPLSVGLTATANVLFVLVKSDLDNGETYTLKVKIHEAEHSFIALDITI